MEHVFDPISNIVIEISNNGDVILTWYKYSLMILTGIIIAVVLGLFEGKKLGISQNDIIDGILIIVPLSIIGTRLWYVIFEWERYAWDFMKIISISDGGLAIHGGFITAFISAYFYTKKRGINLFSAFDIMVPGFLIAQAAGRWGNFFNQEAHGGMIGGVDEMGLPNLSLDEQRTFLDKVLHLPKFISDNMLIHRTDVYEGYMVPDLSPGAEPGDMIRAAYYHPTFLYESMWNILGFIIILLLRRTKWVKNGEFLAFYLVWYGVGRFFIEGMRTDSLYVGNTGLRTAQIISILMVLGAVGYVYFIRRIAKTKPYYQVLLDHVGVDVNKNDKPNKDVKIFKLNSKEQIANGNEDLEL
jgi:phosphatidylglycerol:prolipoprotein diacylglycerol transferase